MNDTNSNDTNDLNTNSDSNGFGCDAFAEELSLFVFGELEDVDRERLAALEQHLIGCAACRSERDALQRSLEILKSDGAKEQQPQLSAERQANLLAQATALARASAQTVAPSSGHVVLLGRWAAAAALVAAAGLGAYAWREFVTEPQQRTELVARREAQKLAIPGETRSFVNQGSNGGPAESVPLDLRGYGYSTDELIDRTAIPESVPALSERESASKAGDGAASPSAGAFFTDPDKYDLKARTEDHFDSLDPSAPAPAAGPVTGGLPSPSTSGQSGRAATPMSVAPLRKLGTGLERAKSAASSSAPTPSERAPAPSGALAGNPNVPDVAAPLQSSGGASACMPPSFEGAGQPAFYDTPDIAGNTTGVTAAMSFPSGDSTLWMGGDENALRDDASRRESAQNVLQSLGYLGDDGDSAGPAPRAPLDPAVIGRILAATCSPGEVVRFQQHLAAALGVDPAHPGADVEKSRDTIVREFLNQLSRRQNEPPRDMFFRYFGDHPFVSTRIDCKSTFGMDVDTASYTLARAYLTKGILPPKAAVRTEEFVNAFKHDLAPPNAEARRDVFAIHTEVAPSPFGDEGQLLLQVGLKARVISKADRKPVALTFIIDVSGSMEQDGRLELVKQSLRMLVNQLDERDSIGIVSFETTAHRILEPVNATHRAAIFASLEKLRPEGSTDVEEGLKFGYAMALEQLKPAGENRVILCSDGVANTGVTDPKVLSARIAECKSKYVYLNCVGVGIGNHNDALMEQLADEGDGFCAYVDRIEEARKLFVERLTGTLMTVARNAKIQVEFDPASVRRFRQIGYENRALAHGDFRNDKVDAGEVGAGQEVVALYEIEPKADAAGPLATVRVRYEDPDAAREPGAAPVVREQARPVFVAEVAKTLQKTTPRFRLSACVAEFAEILRQSCHARDGSLGAIEHLAEPLVDELAGDADVPEFVALVKQAARLPDLLPPRNEMVRAVDELKKLHCWREEIRDAKDAADESLMRQLEEQNRKLEQMLRDSLDRALRHS